jgi:hypothetical protein
MKPASHADAPLSKPGGALENDFAAGSPQQSSSSYGVGLRRTPADTVCTTV